MQTFTGRAFWPLDPRAEEVDPLDIAHSLAHQCRYGGHTSRHYSVAEHCVLVSYSVPPEDALAGLLHDATEAYVTDVPRPVKRHLTDYPAIEEGVWLVIAERFGVSDVLPDSVHEADNRILLNERDALMAPAPISWGVDHLKPLDVVVRGWTAAEAESRYLSRLYELLERAHR